MKKKIIYIILSFLVIFNATLVPVSFVYAQATNAGVQTVIDTSDSNDYESRLQECGFTNIGACGVNFVYYLVLTPSAWFARITGEVFDYFVQYSIDSNSYKGNGNFIERGWAIIRDIGNVMFIFALLYIAISHILQFSSSSTQKFLINIIIAALLINFSLFFCRVIIDAGNILARAFYNNIEIPNDDNIQYHTISQGIVAHVNPQRILASDLFLPKQSNAPAQTTDDKLGNGYAFTILALAAAVNITIGITFLSVCLLFVGRVVGLWFLMIFSPFAFASVAVPNSGKMFGRFSFSGWLDQMMKLSFMAPVFMFFLFLLIMFLQVIFQTNIPTTDQSTVQKLMAVIIPFAMVVFILNSAKKIAGDLAGEAGGAVKSIFGKVANVGLGAVGIAGGAVIGATAFAGRNIIGRAANASIEQGRFQERVRLNNIRAIAYDKKAKEAQTEQERRDNEKKASQARAAAARNAIMVKQLDRARKGTFDVRRSDLLQKQILDSSLGKQVGKQFSNITKEFAGEALGVGFGKGKDTNRKKFEDEKDKVRIETAKLYDRQERENPDYIKKADDASKKGVDGKGEMVSNLNKYIDEVRDSRIMTDEEKTREIGDIEVLINEIRRSNNDEEIKRLGAKGVLDNDGNPMYKGTAERTRERRNAYGDLVERKNIVNDPIFNFNIGVKDAKVTADKIRKGPKGAMDKTLADIVKEVNPPGNNPPTPPNPNPTPPPPNPH